MTVNSLPPDQTRPSLSRVHYSGGSPPVAAIDTTPAAGTTRRLSHRRSGRSRSRRSALAVLCMLAALGPLTVDLYLPTLPAIQADLGTSPAAVQLTVTATTLGLAVGQLLAGAWTDSAMDSVRHSWPR